MKEIKGVSIQYKDKEGIINNVKLTNHDALHYDRVSIHDAAQCYCNANGFTLISSGSCMITIESKKETFSDILNFLSAHDYKYWQHPETGIPVVAIPYTVIFMGKRKTGTKNIPVKSMTICRTVLGY